MVELKSSNLHTKKLNCNLKSVRHIFGFRSGSIPPVVLSLSVEEQQTLKYRLTWTNSEKVQEKVEKFLKRGIVLSMWFVVKSTGITIS